MPTLLGLYKYGESPNGHPVGLLFTFFNYAIMDILVLVAILIHRHFLKQFVCARLIFYRRYETLMLMML